MDFLCSAYLAQKVSNMMVLFVLFALFERFPIGVLYILRTLSSKSPIVPKKPIGLRRSL